MDALVRFMNILIGFNPCSICFRLLLAAVFGGCIGAERGRHGRPAGLRTHTLVSVGACISMMIGLYCVEKIGFNGDPLRIAAQVVSGIGFLGAGTIISDQNAHITGLTTAAGLWTTACIGLAIGLGFYLGAVMSFFIMLVAIVGMSKLEKTRKDSQQPQLYYLEIVEARYVNTVFNNLKDLGQVQVSIARSGITSHVGLMLSADVTKPQDELLKQLQAMEYVLIALPV